MKSHLLASAMLLMALVIPQTLEAAGRGTMDHMKMDHSKMMAQSATKQPTEAGQSAFAAIAEIVALLEADPKTDWSKVDIEALRQHLIDMNNVTLASEVKTVNRSKDVTFIVSGEGPVRDSIRRMLKAHADTMQGVDGWGYAAEITDTGAILKVTPPDEAAATRLAGLGFIGVMARGMHHQEHHFMIAKGMGSHQ